MASTSLLESWSPWPSRANSPKPGYSKLDEPRPATPNAQQGVDHALDTRFRFRLKDYPRDCPPSQIKWYYAVDVGREPSLLGYTSPSDSADTSLRYQNESLSPSSSL